MKCCFILSRLALSKQYGNLESVSLVLVITCDAGNLQAENKNDERIQSRISSIYNQESFHLYIFDNAILASSLCGPDPCPVRILSHLEFLAFLLIGTEKQYAIA